MNVVFNTKTLKVISLFDSPPTTRSDQEILQSMFPQDFKNLSLWNISRNIDRIPIGLSVKLDKSGNPESLLYKGKSLYSSTPEDKEKIRLKTEKEKDKVLSEILPRTLRSSIGLDVIKLWKQSPYTKPEIVKSLTDLQYFSNEKIFPVSWWEPL